MGLHGVPQGLGEKGVAPTDTDPPPASAIGDIGTGPRASFPPMLKRGRFDSVSGLLPKQYRLIWRRRRQRKRRTPICRHGPVGRSSFGAKLGDCVRVPHGRGPAAGEKVGAQTGEVRPTLFRRGGKATTPARNFEAKRAFLSLPGAGLSRRSQRARRAHE